MPSPDSNQSREKRQRPVIDFLKRIAYELIPSRGYRGEPSHRHSKWDIDRRTFFRYVGTILVGTAINGGVRLPAVRAEERELSAREKEGEPTLQMHIAASVDQARNTLSTTGEIPGVNIVGRAYLSRLLGAEPTKLYIADILADIADGVEEFTDIDTATTRLSIEVGDIVSVSGISSSGEQTKVSCLVVKQDGESTPTVLFQGQGIRYYGSLRDFFVSANLQNLNDPIIRHLQVKKNLQMVEAAARDVPYFIHGENVPLFESTAQLREYAESHSYEDVLAGCVTMVDRLFAAAPYVEGAGSSQHTRTIGDFSFDDRLSLNARLGADCSLFSAAILRLLTIAYNKENPIREAFPSDEDLYIPRGTYEQVNGFERLPDAVTTYSDDEFDTSMIEVGDMIYFQYNNFGATHVEICIEINGQKYMTGYSSTFDDPKSERYKGVQGAHCMPIDEFFSKSYLDRLGLERKTIDGREKIVNFGVVARVSTREIFSGK